MAMTPALTTPAGDEIPPPDWADAHTHAEMAAQITSDLAEEFDNDDVDDDPYGVLDFDAQFDSEDEEDVRKEISGYRLGSWMDGIVDAFLRLEEFPETSSGGHSREDLETGNVEPAPSSVPAGSTIGTGSDENVIEPPPERPNGVWDDVVWFGRLIARTVGS